jgi:hypothetical protein
MREREREKREGNVYRGYFPEAIKRLQERRRARIW